MRRWRIVSGWAAMWGVLLSGTAGAQGVGWDGDDFLIAFSRGNGAIAVYDHDLSFKGVLDSGFDEPPTGGQEMSARGLAFDGQGRLVAPYSPNGETPDQLSSIRVYTPDGTRTDAGLDAVRFEVLGPPTGWLNAGVVPRPDGDFLVGSSVGVITTKPHAAGNCPLPPNDTSRACTFGPLSPSTYVEGLAAVGDNTLWAGITNGFGPVSPSDPKTIAALDLTTGELIASIPLDNGQLVTNSLWYDPQTQTVLMADRFSGAVYERRPDGSLVRKYEADDRDFPIWATRGPSGRVYATDWRANEVLQWEADGTFLGAFELSALPDSADGRTRIGAILWAGSVPEPGALAVFGVAGALLVVRRRD